MNLFRTPHLRWRAQRPRPRARRRRQSSPTETLALLLAGVALSLGVLLAEALHAERYRDVPIRAAREFPGAESRVHDHLTAYHTQASCDRSFRALHGRDDAARLVCPLHPSRRPPLHLQEDLDRWVEDFATRCGHLVRTTEVGRSVLGRAIHSLEVSRNVREHDGPGLPPSGKARFKYVANMHGDEPLGRNFLPALAEVLCEADAVGASGSLPSGNDAGILDAALAMLDNVRLFLVPTMNPDGFTSTSAQQRSNSRGVDLNRNFPDPWEERIQDDAWVTGPGAGGWGSLGGVDGDAIGARGQEVDGDGADSSGTQVAVPPPGRNPLLSPGAGQEPETVAMMRYIESVGAHASANLHEGALCANYPFDGRTDKLNHAVHHATPGGDDAAFLGHARSYAEIHADMWASAEFKQSRGVTNGSAWYPVYGGMQDWNYLCASTYEITLELSLKKHPSESLLPSLWSDNVRPLVSHPLFATLGGVRGVAVSVASGRKLEEGEKEAAAEPVVGALILVECVDCGGATSGVKLSLTGEGGEFYRPAAPGRHRVTVLSAGHVAWETEVEVTQGSPTDWGAGGDRLRNAVASAPVVSPALEPCARADVANGTCTGRVAGEAVVADHGWLSPRIAARWAADARATARQADVETEAATEVPSIPSDEATEDPPKTEEATEAATTPSPLDPDLAGRGGGGTEGDALPTVGGPGRGLLGIALVTAVGGAGVLSLRARRKRRLGGDGGLAGGGGGSTLGGSRHRHDV